MHLNGNPRVAVDFSVNTAIFVQRIAEWTFLNLANKINLHDGYCWSYNTLEAFETIFPWWTSRQLETVIKKAVKEGMILRANYNKHKYDRTTWYALSHKALSYYPELTTEKSLQIMAESISPNCEMYNDKLSHEENVFSHFTDLCQAFHQMVTTIPTTNTTNKNTTPISPKGEESSFEDFWELYPVKKGKKQCEGKWKRLKLDKVAIEIITALKNQITNDDQWKRGFVPNPLKYLTGELWNDQIIKREGNDVQPNGSSTGTMFGSCVY